MLFNSQAFILLFMPAAIAGFWFLGQHQARREWWLVAASLFFYGYWDIRFLPLLIGSIIVNWALGQIHARRPSFPVVMLGVPLNLIVIGIFKYADFFVETLAAIMGTTPAPSGIILPIGISFFTFQQISYLIDLRRGNASAYGLRHYALYIAFFPQLIAGPIVRHNELIPQLDRLGRAIDPKLIARGLTFFIIGLAKKTLLADRFSAYVDNAFSQAATNGIGIIDAWGATLAFALQIYFDFSAYSDMAIGLALLFGLTLPFNFNAPYRARSISDFWRRWHMTLSRFFRDYLYIPLGGNRHGIGRQMAALFITMAFCGLWHGAGWTFVAWGALHGTGLMVHALWRRADITLPAVLGWALTFMFVLIGWVLFRAQSMAEAMAVWQAMAGLGAHAAPLIIKAPWPAIAGGLLLVFAMPTSQKLVETRLQPRPRLAIGLGVSLAVLVLMIGKSRPVEFIYFAF